MKKWTVDLKDKWLIFTRRGVKIDNYPAIKAHLSQWKDELTPKKTGKEAKGRKPGNYKWFEIQDEIAYFAEFDAPKILYQEIATFQAFALDTTGAYINNKIFLIGSGDFYLLGVLNSAFAWEFLNDTCTKMLGGTFAMQKPFVEQIPIPNAPESEREVISELVQKCLDARGVNCEAWEAEINARVATLYGL